MGGAIAVELGISPGPKGYRKNRGSPWRVRGAVKDLSAI